MRFQFLIGRLAVAELARQADGLFEFQFLIGRLAVYAVSRRPQKPTRVSIPHR